MGHVFRHFTHGVVPNFSNAMNECPLNAQNDPRFLLEKIPEATLKIQATCLLSHL